MGSRPTIRLARTLLRSELSRLRALGARITLLPTAEGRAALYRFAQVFVDAPRLPTFLERLDAMRESSRQLDFSQWFPPEASARRPALGCLTWLGGGDTAARCIRFEPRVALGAMELAIASFEEVWITSWPGLYVHLANERAFFVNVDYEITRCDMRMGRASPYR